jgi:hypothetical protein
MSANSRHIRCDLLRRPVALLRRLCDLEQIGIVVRRDATGHEGSIALDSSEIPETRGGTAAAGSQAAPSERRPWSTPTVIVSDLLNTRAHVTFGSDGSSPTSYGPYGS